MNDISRRKTKVQRLDVQVGAVFGRLTVLARGQDKLHGIEQKRFPTWRCRCSCGAEREVLDNALRMGRSTSCGCLRSEKNAAVMRERHATKGSSGPANPAWKGGRVTTRKGYVEAWVAKEDPLFCMARAHTGAGGYVFEHRLVVARALGRPLHEHEEVHHIDGNRSNNRLENLQLRFTGHGAGIVLECACCGSRNLRPAPIKG